jgi:hypothetical protein
MAAPSHPSGPTLSSLYILGRAKRTVETLRKSTGTLQIRDVKISVSGAEGAIRSGAEARGESVLWA